MSRKYFPCIPSPRGARALSSSPRGCHYSRDPSSLLPRAEREGERRERGEDGGKKGTRGIRCDLNGNCTRCREREESSTYKTTTTTAKTSLPSSLPPFHFLLTSCCSFLLHAPETMQAGRLPAWQRETFPGGSRGSGASTRGKFFGSESREKWKVGICVCGAMVWLGRGGGSRRDINQEASL